MRQMKWFVLAVGLLLVGGNAYFLFKPPNYTPAVANPIDFHIEVYKQGGYICAKSVHLVGKNHVIECVDINTLGIPGYYPEE